MEFIYRHDFILLLGLSLIHREEVENYGLLKDILMDIVRKRSQSGFRKLS